MVEYRSHPWVIDPVRATCSDCGTEDVLVCARCGRCSCIGPHVKCWPEDSKSSDHNNKENAISKNGVSLALLKILAPLI